MRLIFILIIYLFFTTNAFSQDVLFKIDTECHSQKSIFSKVRIIDKRTPEPNFWICSNRCFE
jgi:hypothetical protein